MLPNHLAAIGLALDFVGVLILAWDILPEYLNWKRHRDAGIIAPALLKDEETSLESFGPPGSPMSQVVGMERFRRRMAAIALVAKFESLNGIHPIFRDIEQSNAATLTDIRKRLTELQVIDATRDVSNRAERPNILFGVTLIAVGFLIQIAAALMQSV